MPYYTYLFGFTLSWSGDTPDLGSDTPPAESLFDRFGQSRSVEFSAVSPAVEGATEVAPGGYADLEDGAGSPLMAGARFAGFGSITSTGTVVGGGDYVFPPVAIELHPLEGYFVQGPGGEVYFVSDAPVSPATVGIDIRTVDGSAHPLNFENLTLDALNANPPPYPLAEPGYEGLTAYLRQQPKQLRLGAEHDPSRPLALGPTGPPPCFTPGTLIETARGPRAVETLVPGDLLCTVDRGLQVLRWVGRAAVSAARLRENPGLRPVRIGKGALGAGQPGRDLLVSPQHRVLVRSKVAGRMLGAPEVLVAARQLLGLPGIAPDGAPDGASDGASVGVVYHHLLLDRHELLWSNGAITESLYAGPQALRGLDPAARREILTLFPGLRERLPRPARPLVPGRKARRLAARHGLNRRPLLS